MAVQHWRIGVGLVAGILAGCETTMDLLDRKPKTEELIIRMTAEGVDGLTAATPYDTTQILKAMPGYSAGTVLISLEKETVTATVLYSDESGTKSQILHVVPTSDGHIGQIHGVSRQIAGPGGERPGMSLTETRTDPKSCRPGTGLWGGLVICRSVAVANVALVFSLRGQKPGATTLPKPGDLAGAELQRIIWTPPA